MSGMEVVAAVSLASSVMGSMKESQIAEQTAKTQQAQLREASVQLRLQQNEQTIERQKKLQRVLAAEQVSAGARGITPGSGSIRALSMENFNNFLADENASALSFASKQLALKRQGQLVEQNRSTKQLGIGMNLAKEAGSTGYDYYKVPSNESVNASRYKSENSTSSFYNKNFKPKYG